MVKSQKKINRINKKINYILNIGRDILYELGLICTWQEVSISTKPPNCETKNSLYSKKV